MKTTYVNSLDEYVKIILSSGSAAGYRGVSDHIAHKLLPGIGRGYFDNIWLSAEFEKKLFKEFKQKLARFEKNKSDFECAVIAQHYGVPTRLLDWTTNPFVALFFSLNSKISTDGCVYIISHSTNHINDDDVDYLNILNETSPDNDYFLNSKTNYRPIYDEMILNKFNTPFSIVNPSSITDRIEVQSSFFTIHYNPFSQISEEIIMKIIIKNDIQKTIERQLNLFGVNSYTLFPDLEGLGASFRKRFTPFIPS